MMFQSIRTLAPFMTRLIAGAALFTLTVGALTPVAYADYQTGNNRNNVIIGRDTDNPDNPEIQPITPPPDQSLEKTDILKGRGGNDIVIGLLGNDLIEGNRNNDVLIGGPEQFVFPNKDLIFGNQGNDINIWAPGDGSDAFVGGPGNDAQVFGVIDRDSANVPTLSRRTGLPEADVTGSPGFCEIEPVETSSFGFDFLARFFVRTTGNPDGNLSVTIRLKDVEQVFCTSRDGGEITYADLTSTEPTFREVSLDEVKMLNRKVSKIVR